MITHVYAVKTPEELSRYQEIVRRIQPKLDAYISLLARDYAVQALPKAIVWTSAHTATQLISDIPVPAYTNEHRIVMTPDLDTWRGIYLKQLDDCEEANAVKMLRSYYQTGLSENHILQILGHELAHHSELFLDEFDFDYEYGIWFEEGMAEYISRRYFLTDEEFEAEAAANRQLIDLYQQQHRTHSMEEFGSATYDKDYAGIFYEYWRSFLAVNRIVNDHNGNVQAVFQSYHRWHESRTARSLEEWFGLHHP